MFAGLSSDCLSMWVANLSPHILTISDWDCIPELHINSSLLTWSLHDISHIFWIHHWRNSQGVADLGCGRLCLTSLRCCLQQTCVEVKFDGIANGLSLPYWVKSENWSRFTQSHMLCQFQDKLIGDLSKTRNWKSVMHSSRCCSCNLLNCNYFSNTHTRIQPAWYGLSKENSCTITGANNTHSLS